MALRPVHQLRQAGGPVTHGSSRDQIEMRGGIRPVSKWKNTGERLESSLQNFVIVADQTLNSGKAALKLPGIGPAKSHVT